MARLEHELVTALDAAVTSTTAEATALRRLSSTGGNAPTPDGASVAALEARLVAVEARAEAEARARRTLEQRTKRLEAELSTALEAAVSAAASETRDEARAATGPSGGDVRAAVAKAVDQLRGELEASLRAARGGQGGRHEDASGLEVRVTRLERELGTALEAAVSAASAEANGGSQRRRGPSDADLGHVMDSLRSLEARVADADGTVRRCEQEALRASAAAVSALTGVLAVKDHTAAGSGAHPSSGADGHGGGGGGASVADVNHLRLRVQALETASDGSTASAPGQQQAQQLVGALGGRVEELEAALVTIRDALSAMASRQVHLQQQEAAQGAQAQGLAHAQQRLTSLESRVEAAEAALTAASEAASRAETAAAGAAVAAASARRAADEAPRAAAHAMASMGGLASPRVTHSSAPAQPPPGTPSAASVQALAGRVRGVEANVEAVRGDTSNMRHNVDALALVVEQLAGRLDALEGDVAEALRAVASQLGALEQTPGGSPTRMMMSTPQTGRR